MSNLTIEARASKIWFDKDNMWLSLSDGRQLSVPLIYLSRLHNATDQQRGNYELSDDGMGLHWVGIGEYISVPDLLKLQEVLQLKESVYELTRRAEEELPKILRKALQRLGEEGWFFTQGMPDDFLNILRNKDENKLSEWFKNFFRERLDDIKQKLIDSYPDRGHILQEAFEAHSECKYNLSVPVFLAQADGIFGETTSEKQSLFIAKQRKEATGKHASQILGYTANYVHPLEITLPLWMSEGDRAKGGGSFVRLNRHQVLHGESVDYGTEENSLKAISLLNYLHWILSQATKQRPIREE